MQVITEQLKKYHQGRKLRGAALNSAVQADVRRVDKNRNVELDEVSTLDVAFVWADSPEGHKYWAARCYGGA